jgi:hypothetical protein
MPGYFKTAEEVERIENFLQPSRFTCDELRVGFTTSWDFARSVTPPDLDPVGDKEGGTAGAFAFVTTMESAYCGRFDCAAVGVEASYGDVHGSWILTLIVSGEFPVQIGRELWGEVKKTGTGRLYRDGSHILGVGERRGIDVINIEAEITGPQKAPFVEKSAAFDVKMFPASDARGLQYPPLLNTWDITSEYTSYHEGTAKLWFEESEWDPTFTIPILSVGPAAAVEYVGTYPLGDQVELKDPDNVYPGFLWGRSHDDPTRMPIASRWLGEDEINPPPTTSL